MRIHLEFSHTIFVCVSNCGLKFFLSWIQVFRTSLPFLVGSTVSSKSWMGTRPMATLINNSDCVPFHDWVPICSPVNFLICLTLVTIVNWPFTSWTVAIKIPKEISPEDAQENESRSQERENESGSKERRKEKKLLLTFHPIPFQVRSLVVSTQFPRGRLKTTFMIILTLANQAKNIAQIGSTITAHISGLSVQSFAWGRNHLKPRWRPDFFLSVWRWWRKMFDQWRCFKPILWWVTGASWGNKDWYKWEK